MQQTVLWQTSCSELASLSHSLGDSGIMCTVHIKLLDGKLVVIFVCVIIKLYNVRMMDM